MAETRSEQKQAELSRAEGNEEGPVENCGNSTGPEPTSARGNFDPTEVKAEFIKTFGLGQLGRSKTLGHRSINSTVRYTSLAASRFNGLWSD